MSKSFTQQTSETNNKISIIAIHGTILSIFIAIIISYSIYYRGVTYNLELEVIKEAERINNIVFMRSVYYPSKGCDQQIDNVNRALIGQRTEILKIKTVKEDKTSELSFPSNPDDIAELFRYLHFLNESIFPMAENDYSIGNNKFIPKDSANRGEEILRVINLLGHCYLFPEAPFETPAVFKRESYNKKYFVTISEVRNLLTGLNVFVVKSKEFRSYQYLFPENIYLKQLKKRDKKLLKVWESSRISRGFGNINPDKLFNDFLFNTNKVEEIANATNYKIMCFDKFSTELPPKLTTVIIYIIIGCVFLSSVIAPLMFQNLPKYFYIHIPIIFYVGVYFYIYFAFIV